MIRNSALCLAAVALITASSPADMPIERLAPKNTVFVVGVKNVQESREHLKGTPLWSLIKSEPVTQMWADMMAEIEPDMDQALAELGVERESLSLPEGGLGGALFWVRDEEIGMPFPGLLLYADWGEKADGTADVIEKAIAKVEQEEGFAHEVVEIAGRKAYRFELPEEEPREEGEDEWDDIDMGGGGMGMGGMFGDPAAVLENIEAVYYVRSGSAFLFCTDLPAMSNALEVLDGKEHPSLADRDDFRSCMSMTGEGDVYGAWLMRDATQLLGGPQGMGMGAMFVPILKQFVGDIQGFASATRIDGEKAMIEKTTAVYMPNGRSGFTALMDTQTPRGESGPPMGLGAIGYHTVNFEFTGLPTLVNAISQMFPIPGLQPPPGQEGPSPIEMMKQVCDPLGPQIHIVQSIKKPITMASMQPLIAIQCTEPGQIEGFLTEAGLVAEGEVRELKGGRIHKLSADALPGIPEVPGMPEAPSMEAVDVEMSLGIGSEFMFIGPTADVEQVLALSGGDWPPSVDNDVIRQHAVDLLGDGPFIGWGYIDAVTLMEAQIELQRQVMEQAVAEIGEEDERVEAGEGFMDDPLLAALMQFDVSELHKYIGPTVWEAHATEQGFVINNYQLAPLKKATE